VYLVHQVKLAQPVNAVVKVQKVQPVFQVFQVLMVLTVLQVLQVNKLLHKLLVLSFLDTPKLTPTQAAQLVPFLFGLVTPFSTPLVTTTTMLKIWDPLAHVPRNLTPCQLPSAVATKFADTLVEMPNLTG
jgi:hypothetical protein